MADYDWKTIVIGTGIGLAVFIIGGLFAVAMVKGILGADLLVLANSTIL